MKIKPYIKLKRYEQLNIGDKVRVKSNGFISFGEHSQFNGKVVTITKKEDGYFNIKEINGGRWFYYIRFEII